MAPSEGGAYCQVWTPATTLVWIDRPTWMCLPPSLHLWPVAAPSLWPVAAPSLWRHQPGLYFSKRNLTQAHC